MNSKSQSGTIWDDVLDREQLRRHKVARWELLRKGTEIEKLDAGLFANDTVCESSEANQLAVHSRQVSENYGLSSAQTCWHISDRIESTDGKSIKLRLESQEGDACECVVLLPRSYRATVCVSSQIGCAVGCVFCATGQMGLRRNLTTPEIVEQLYYARQMAFQTDRHLRNVVFMGMGEPLHNFDVVLDTLDWISSVNGFGMSLRHVSVSTIGIPSKMLELGRQFPLVRIALSLHSVFPEVRKKLVPRSTADLDVLRETIVELNRMMPTHPLWLEYVLLKGINDSDEDASGLIEFCKGLDVEINVIPYNEISLPSPIQPNGQLRILPILGSGIEIQEQFVQRLRAAGIFTTLRKSLGQSIAAACGQLVVNA
ncbi:MAG: radical SAM protein [Pirellulaceae bacterium]|nr:radical SAM protein [Pirellulaceae bacterium]